MRVLLVTFALVGCSGAKDTDPDLPPVDSADTTRDTDVSTFPPDTSADSDISDSPSNTLTMHQFGQWDLSPGGGPYTALTGTLTAQEYFDGNAPPTDTDDSDTVAADTDLPLECDVVYNLVGAPALSTCDGCSFAFDITFHVIEGDPTGCRDPEIPQDDGILRFGYDNTQHKILMDYGDIGLWLPWYPARLIQDHVKYDWKATVGVVVEEEE
jgi:hypothetical protein